MKISALQAEYRKRAAATARDDAPSAGEIRSLGLLEATKEEVHIKSGKLFPGYKDNLPRGDEAKAKAKS